MSSVGGVGRLNPELIEDIMFRLSCGERHRFCLADPRNVGPVCKTDRHKNECANEWNGTFEDADGVTHQQLALPDTYYAHTLFDFRLSADGSRAALLYRASYTLFLFDTESGTQIGSAFNMGPVGDFVLSDDGMKIASVHQGRVYIWNMALSMPPVANVLVHEHEWDDYSSVSRRFQRIWLNSYSFNHSGSLFLTSRDDSIIIWDIVSTFAAIRTLTNHDDLYGLWHPMRDRTVVFTNMNGDLMLWSISEQSDHLELVRTTREQFEDPNNIDTFHILRLREENEDDGDENTFDRVANIVYGYRGNALGAFYNHFIAVNNSNHETEFSVDTTEDPWTIVRTDRRVGRVAGWLCLGIGEFAALRFVNPHNGFFTTLDFTRWETGQPVRPLGPFPGIPLFRVKLPNGNSTIVYDMGGTLFLWRGTGYDMRINPSMAGILRDPRIREVFLSWDYTTMAVVLNGLNTVHVFCGIKPSMYHL